jgi:cold shock CspA family protein
MNNAERISGKIITVNKLRGYGFISSKQVPFTKIYFHWTNLVADTVPFTELKKGDPVEFKLIENFIDRKTNEEMGPRALNIEVLEKPDGK